MLQHELRSPLTGILGITSLLLDKHRSGTSHDQLEALLRSGRQLRSLIDTLQPGRQPTLEARKLELRWLDGQVLLEQCIRAHWPSARAKGIQLHLVYSPGTPAMWRGDEVALRQVLDNLIGNAIKFTDLGYVAVIVNRIARFSTAAEDLEIGVMDTGIGLKGLGDRRIYDVGVQASPVGLRKYGSRGLGLHCCERIIRQYRGWISHQTHAFGGAHFTVVLPGLLARFPGIEPDQKSALLQAMRCVVTGNGIVRLVLTNWLIRLGVHFRLAEHSSPVSRPWPENCDVVFHAVSPQAECPIAATGPISTVRNSARWPSACWLQVANQHAPRLSQPESFDSGQGCGNSLVCRQLPVPLMLRDVERILLQAALARIPWSGGSHDAVTAPVD